MQISTFLLIGGQAGVDGCGVKWRRGIFFKKAFAPLGSEFFPLRIANFFLQKIGLKILFTLSFQRERGGEERWAGGRQGGRVGCRERETEKERERERERERESQRAEAC